MRPRWDAGPAELVLVRHGESAGNLADAAARDAGAEVLDLTARDADVELSETGRGQAAALGRWLRERPPEERPTVTLSSPYRRAAETATLALGDLGPEPEIDERLRERDLGLLDGLTRLGVERRLPEEARRRERLGKFWYQPPGGESWADVALRVRQLLTDLRHGYDGDRVWVFTHQAVIMTFRYVLDGIDEAAVMDLDRRVPIPNASVTTYRRSGPLLELASFADTTPVDAEGERVTREEPVS